MDKKSKQKQKWSNASFSGPDFPDDNGVYGAGSIPFEDSFLVVGGSDDGGVDFTDNIYKYNPAEEDWELREEKLSSPKYHFAYVFADREDILC